jgi:predicted membrane protein
MTERSYLTPRLVVGLGVTLLGVLLLGDRLELFDAGEIVLLWPAILVLVGVVQLLRPQTSSSRSWGLVWVVAGGWLLFNNLGWMTFDFREAFWPLVLVLAGATLVWRALRGPQDRRPHDDTTVHGFALMGGTALVSASPGFRGGDLNAIMGGCELDLRKAQVEGDEAVVDVFTLWGGIDIRVPETWKVVGKVVPIMGAFEDKTRQPQAAAGPRLVVRGLVLMGAVEVKN